ncbi:urease accessory protein UreF [Hoyosella rhizosphaerae]|uniref:Urease accessory protein (UreF) n=1 Tax=Hoyosella rhizosphaerae TaxID=1755582 RepID=A0A916XA81_9ACTN|nr:urease accessory UreF family protein [Hoyosella rhizosphaerae]MBN4926739.1 urease accessory protein UreF [Hoyosella rhizosphaerae]GGC56849.1 urease accessory protein (UreF) [Hoyosella rhizosphaerae]
MLTDLLALADSRLPIGGHVHSGGMEEAVTSGVVHDVATVEAFLERRIRTTGLVTGSIAAAVCNGLDPVVADGETDARTPSPAARDASRIQGRGFVRLAKSVWPDYEWSVLGRKPHLPVVTGVAGSLCALTPRDTALAVIYTVMTGSATAAQRLLALDPAHVAVCTFRLSTVCDDTASLAATKLHSLSDPLFDVLAERHMVREMPLFVS